MDNLLYYVKALSYNKFLDHVNSILLKSGNKPPLTGHSFRRGGATWAFQVGLPGEAIQDIGMWKSEAYLRYIEPSLNTKIGNMRKFGQKLPSN